MHTVGGWISSWKIDVWKKRFLLEVFVFWFHHVPSQISGGGVSFICAGSPRSRIFIQFIYAYVYHFPSLASALGVAPIKGETAHQNRKIEAKHLVGELEMEEIK